MQAWQLTITTSGASRTVVESNIRTFGVSFGTNPSLGHTSAVSALVVAATGLVFSGGQDGRVFAWNLTSGSTAPVLSLTMSGLSAVNALVVAPPSPIYPGEILISGHLNADVRLWDALSGSALQTLPGAQPAGVYSLSVLPDQTLVTGGADGSINLWNPVTRQRWTPKALQVRTGMHSSVDPPP